MNIHNHDIVGIYQRVNRFIEELFKSVSSGVSEMNEFDQTRLVTYLTNIKTYHDWVRGQPHLDLPESHPKIYELPTPPEIAQVENEEINDLLRLLVLARDELTNCQSARNASNLMDADSGRFIALITKCETFLETYIKTVTPLDLPESSPAMPLSGAGSTGV